ncbi:hypothetical protein C8R43DRAFT_1143909 [Mycena crocata]|nr:hypothetical protein C8R43DRAFT_1143909 [Mycena crocata]
MGLGISGVRCFSKPNDTSRRLNNSGVTGSAFITGDLFVTLVRNSKMVSLAILRSLEITHDGQRTTEINSKTIGNTKSNVKLKGQILLLKAVPSIPEDAEDGEVDELSSEWTWLWRGTYLMGTSEMKGTDIATDSPLTLTVPGHLVELINPNVADAGDRLTDEEVKYINSTGATWALDDVGLRAVMVELWKRFESAKLNIKTSLPYFKPQLDGFPYTWSSGKHAMVCDEATSLIGTLDGIPCLYCPEIPANWRAHMGAHILRKLNGIAEPVTKKTKGTASAPTVIYPEVAESYPCGFCGRSGRSECPCTVKPHNGTVTINTNCEYMRKIHYKLAEQGSTATPCRNVPVVCGLCPEPQERYPTYPAVWRYNMPQHLQDAHPEYASPNSPDGDLLPLKIWDSVKLTREEEKAAGIPDRRVPFSRFEPHEIIEQSGARKKRKHAASSGVPDQPKSKKR